MKKFDEMIGTMTGKESLKKYHCAVPCRMCEHSGTKAIVMPCLMCVIYPKFSKGSLKIEYRKFIPKK